jgi:PadR family transcriptional regulator, regulatory protein PadR
VKFPSAFPVAMPQDPCHTPVTIPQEQGATAHVMPTDSKSEILQGTLDLMVLKTLAAMGSLHGYGIARRIEQISEEALQINQGTIYASLVRLLHKGWIAAEWGTSENNRKARFYSITKSGRKQLHAETQNWRRIAGVIGRVLNVDERS